MVCFTNALFQMGAMRSIYNMEENTETDGQVAFSEQLTYSVFRLLLSVVYRISGFQQLLLISRSLADLLQNVFRSHCY